MPVGATGCDHGRAGTRPARGDAGWDRLGGGIAEQMRLQGARKTRFAALSRAVCGVRGTSLILNLPGSPAGAVESLEAVMDLLPHALELIAGKTEHERRQSLVASRWQNCVERTGWLASDQRLTTKRLTTASRKLYSLEQDQ